MGWLMVRKHPDVITKGRTIDLSDLEQDPIVVWQRRLVKLFFKMALILGDGLACSSPFPVPIPTPGNNSYLH